MRDFAFHAPSTLDEALALMSREGVRALSGGTDLIPQVREGRRPVTAIVDLKRIDVLRKLTRDTDGGWRIGAAVSVGEMGRDAAFTAEHDTLMASARLIGSLQVQNRAGVVGNICNAAPSADAVPLLICLGAMVEILGPAGRRTLPVGQVASGPGRTSLQPGEIVTAVLLPPQPKRSRGHYLRFTPRREMDIAIAGSAGWIALDARGAITDARIALASVAPVPLVAKAAAAALVGKVASLATFKEAAAVAAAECQPISDARGSADYRRDLVAVLTRRVLEQSARDLGCDVA